MTLRRAAGGVVLAVLLVSALQACGSDDDGATASQGTGATLFTVEKCKTLFTTLCSRIEACSPLNMRIAYGDAASCKERLSST
jgi:hypothetical protein